MYGKDYERYKDIRDALNEGEYAFVNEQTGEVRKVAAEDMVNSPAHYTQGGIEAITAIEASMPPEAYEGYLKGNIMKYMWRYEKKAKPVEDLKKARWYLDRLIMALNKEPN